MELEITSKEKQPLFSRQDIKFVIIESKTPRKEEVRKKIAALHNAKEDAVVIEKITNRFGDKRFEGRAKIYDSKEKMEEMEPGHIITRNFGKKEAAKAGVAAQPKQEKK